MILKLLTAEIHDDTASSTQTNAGALCAPCLAGTRMWMALENVVVWNVGHASCVRIVVPEVPLVLGTPRCPRVYAPVSGNGFKAKAGG